MNGLVMRAYTLTHLSDAVLLRDLTALVAQDRTTTAALLAHIAEVDARRLYVPAGYSSMHAYCVEELRLSEDAALKRIQAARAGRQFPALLTALAEGRLHLTAVRLLAPYLNSGNAEELLAAATNRSKAEIERWLAQRFPLPEAPARVQVLRAIPPAPNPQHAPGHVEDDASDLGGLLAPAQVPVANPPPKLAPPAPERFQLTVGKATHDKLRYAQELLSHAIPSGDLTQVLDRALDALIGRLERRKFAASAKPRPRQQATANSRFVPAHVRHAVWERDGGRCTFVSQTGHRCGSRKFIELDHIDPVARGGQATVEGMRLLCRAHNQYEAERVFGASFMREKRQQTQRAAADPQRKAAAHVQVAAQEQARDVMAGLLGLGIRADKARRAAEFCQRLPEATLEDRMRAALKFICPKRAIRPERLS